MSKSLENKIDESVNKVMEQLLNDDYKCKKFIAFNTIMNVLSQENMVSKKNVEEFLTEKLINKVTDKQVKNIRKNIRK